MAKTDIETLELGLMSAWPAARSVWHNGWVLRWTNGYSKRANSVTPIYKRGADLAKQVAWCEQYYKGLGWNVIFRETPLGDGAEMAAYLEGNGYARFDKSIVPIRELSEKIELNQNVVWEDWSTRAVSWVSLAAKFRGDDAGEHEHVALLERIVNERVLAVGYVDKEPVVIGVGVRFGQWVSIFEVLVAKDRRREGWGRAITERFMSWGKDRGATHACLQVVRANEAAYKLYETLGFENAYEYIYWRKEDG
ncbi:MAG TPA: GNAT family N-acetyltransferase [Anaerolineae bacterium]|nr:GNAT family N-acetyltransferase [Anaerolineae bacterium]